MTKAEMIKLVKAVERGCEYKTPMSRNVLTRFMKKSGVGWLLRWAFLNVYPCQVFLEDWTAFTERVTRKATIAKVCEVLEGDNESSGKSV